ncbi:alpha-L-fucosidase [Georgenia deserti]|uniref:alpha-L-fucosidase n=1 Tax=Georgenia deserti TaxID=2093781 RepID=A0ABW4L0F7_9MICO
MTETARWDDLRRPTPEWYRRSPFGIFIHWGAYSVPAWAEPTGELGTVDDARVWFTHNAYAEWYYNTIRIDGSPAQQHHREVYGDADYDDFLDLWRAEHFDADELIGLIGEAGADYVVPTTKHHDGIALWDAPETGTRNTVHRGPRRDLIAEIATAAGKHGLHLGLYYSGGLDWHYRPMPPHLSNESVHDTGRPKDADYARYAYLHLRDLIERFDPDILWNDIEWPDAGKHFGEHGLGALFEDFYRRNPDGLVNDRFGRDTHHDYATSEYQAGREAESEEQWENNRGIGLSFGYNQVEGPEHCLDGPAIARHLTDVVSRGGHFLLNVGPKADGTLPDNQRRALSEMGRWMAVAKPALVGAEPSAAEVHADDAWVRAVDNDDETILFVDRPEGEQRPAVLTGLGQLGTDVAEASWGSVRPREAGTVVVDLQPGRPGPALLRLRRRR